ncbi:MAG: dihydropteroate synthase [Nitrospinae bacterium CG11_big_fil_rev_8_21_14_0_20_56_8]|nr:MAG: dihydropteroate synthase [Nitrospinae bacterium CG11_big_fil_rev_8_21_14_0_20_56_8]
MTLQFMDKVQAGETAIMGVINLSPDSFHTASRCPTLGASLEAAARFVEEGADILDLGAESTRPGSHPIDMEVERDRLVPVVAEMRRRFPATAISVDTYKPGVAEAVLDQGADLINDITGLQRYTQMAEVIGRHRAGVVLMHMQGMPETMQVRPCYDDLLGEIRAFLAESIARAEKAGISPGRIIIDPGIGFGKTPEHNLKLINRLGMLKDLGKPILLGVSRKSFIGQILNLPVEEREEGSLASGIVGILRGASILRVHDVQSTARALRMVRAIIKESIELE